MKPQTVLILIMALAFSGAPALAADFGWIDDFDVVAAADPSGFHARLAARFHIGDVQVSAVIGDCDRPADAYLVLRYGELSGLPVEQVLRHYRVAKGKGWGVIAQRLGIKPGSPAFQALKRGDDLFTDADRRKATASGKEAKSGGKSGKGGGAEADQGPGHGHGKGKGPH